MINYDKITHTAIIKLAKGAVKWRSWKSFLVEIIETVLKGKWG